MAWNMQPLTADHHNQKAVLFSGTLIYQGSGHISLLFLLSGILFNMTHTSPMHDKVRKRVSITFGARLGKTCLCIGISLVGLF